MWFSVKATKIWRNLPFSFDIMYLLTSKLRWRFRQILKVFTQYINFSYLLSPLERYIRPVHLHLSKEFCTNLLFCVYLGYFSLVLLDKAKWVQLNGKTLQVLKNSLVIGFCISHSFWRYLRIYKSGIDVFCLLRIELGFT